MTKRSSYRGLMSQPVFYRLDSRGRVVGSVRARTKNEATSLFDKARIKGTRDVRGRAVAEGPGTVRG